MKKLLLIDGSSYLYRAFHALPDLRNKENQPTGVIYGVLNMLKKIHEDYPVDYSLCIFDAKGKTFRNDIYPDYKANRPSMPDDLARQIEPLHDAIQNMGWPMLSIPGVEADDVIGTLCKKAKLENIQTIISTGDKDMAQLVNSDCFIINTMSNEKLDIDGVKNKFGVLPEQIIDYLTLVGDKVDNVPGVEKVGPKTALKLLEEFGSLENIISNADAVKGSVGENLRAAISWLPTGKKLITIKDDVEIPDPITSFIKKDANKDKLLQIYEKYNFYTWIKKDFENQNQNEKVIKEQEQAAKFNNKKNYTTILTLSNLEEWIHDIQNKKIFAIDTETDSLNFIDARLIGISLCTSPGSACYIPLQHLNAEQQLNLEQVLNLIKPILEDPNIKKIGQNIKYDMHIFKNYGIQLNGIQHDTMLLSYVHDSTESHGMNKLAEKYLEHPCISYEDVVGKGTKQITFDLVDIEAATEYAAEDADVTFQLFQTLYPKINSNEKLKYIYENIEIPTLISLFEIERNGVLIDSSKLHDQSLKLGNKIIEIEKEAFKIAEQPFNLSSPKQLQEILFSKLGIKPLKKTPTGAASTSEDVLEELALNYPLPKIILEHRSLSKLKNTYTDKLPRMINSKTNRVHTSYNQAVAITGRLASSDPNLQNIPIRNEEGRRVREAFIAPKNYQIVSCDYSQIELRIMAHLSCDEGLISAFKNNLDIHQSTAAKIFNLTTDDVTKEQRRYAKVINFGLIYGMSTYGLSQALNIDRESAKNFIEDYFIKYPAVKNFMDETKLLAKEQGFIETVFGRKLWLREINSTNGIRRAAAERAAINAPMQGTAADLIKLSMNKIQEWLTTNKLQSKIIMQVHDELVLEVPENELSEIQKNIPRIMCGITELKIPLVADLGFGLNWEVAH